jgi:hypothetical protein
VVAWSKATLESNISAKFDSEPPSKFKIHDPVESLRLVSRLVIMSGYQVSGDRTVLSWKVATLVQAYPAWQGVDLCPSIQVAIVGHMLVSGLLLWQVKKLEQSVFICLSSFIDGVSYGAHGRGFPQDQHQSDSLLPPKQQEDIGMLRIPQSRNAFSCAMQCQHLLASRIISSWYKSTLYPEQYAMRR